MGMGALLFPDPSTGQQYNLANISNGLLGSSHTIGLKHYELTDHLGNVLVSVLDRKVGYLSNPSNTLYDYWLADIAGSQDYYPYGMLMAGRTYLPSDKKDYKFGFNGQMKTDEISGKGNHNTALFWEYDTRLGRRWNLDPVTTPSVSSYSVMENNPILRNDPNGDYSRVGAWIRNKLWGGEGIAKQNSGKDKGKWGVRYGQEEMTSEGKAFVSHFQTGGSRHLSFDEQVEQNQWNRDNAHILGKSDLYAPQEVAANNEVMSGRDKARWFLDQFAIAGIASAPQLAVTKMNARQWFAEDGTPLQVAIAGTGGSRASIRSWLKTSGSLSRTQLTKELEGAGFKRVSPLTSPSVHYERGGVKIRLDQADRNTPFNHMHINFGSNKNSYDVNLNPVNYKSIDAHIPIK